MRISVRQPAFSRVVQSFLREFSKARRSLRMTVFFEGADGCGVDGSFSVRRFFMCFFAKASRSSGYRLEAFDIALQREDVSEKV